MRSYHAAVTGSDTSGAWSKFASQKSAPCAHGTHRRTQEPLPHNMSASPPRYWSCAKLPGAQQTHALLSPVVPNATPPLPKGEEKCYVYSATIAGEPDDRGHVALPTSKACAVDA